jgi:hypothetical protein
MMPIRPDPFSQDHNTPLARSISLNSTSTVHLNSVVDSHHFDADPDSTYHADADPDADPDPTFHSYADPDPNPDPSFQIKAQTLEKC